MKVKAKMGGSINYLPKEKIRPRLTELVEIIDGYGLMKVLSDDSSDVLQEYVEQEIVGVIVQTIIGKNYRINLFEDDSIQIIFQKRKIDYEQIMMYKEVLKELKFKNRTTYKSDGYGGTFLLKSTVDIDKNVNHEDIIKIFSLFNIE